ncbi:hypothetical protein Phum_PHUM016600 [Pediculus humanus corporis]|uniref:Uncharacterized protein n=1 Tax=Pediculus humanus subsp. corporis TaxID=121224 RepID=E0V9M6_PEDHC|nr:uncharacterized protein Phum_PHUM016600 [Pediculus humanus corporis]EEB10082.1 hypothetical protein Phum_PHUM016600 [Pediculus humanus corporis]
MFTHKPPINSFWYFAKSDKELDLKTLLEDSLGQLYLSLCFLNSNENAKKLFLPEETEYNNLDKSIEELDSKNQIVNNDNNDFSGKDNISPSSTTVPPCKRPQRLEGLDKFPEVSPRNQDLLRLSLRLNGNRPNTPTRYGNSSYYSDADSGIGTTTPTKRISGVTSMNQIPWVKINPEVLDILSTPHSNKNNLTVRSNRSYNFENDSPTRKTSSFKSNRSLDIETFFLNRSPLSDYRNFDVASLHSLSIPMGSSDGRKIIKRSITSPEDLQNLNNK